MLVPLYVLIMGFSPKYAIPLSNITVFGGACANFIMNQRKRHPTADRPLMDWDLILVMQPMTIAGALLGSFLNKLLPELILTISLVLLLGYTTHTTLKKGFQAYAKESKAAKDAANASALSRMMAQAAAHGGATEKERLLTMYAGQGYEALPCYDQPDWVLALSGREATRYHRKAL